MSEYRESYLKWWQVWFANRTGKVERVGFCHGGDVLYRLDSIRGTWHESCLRQISEDFRLTDQPPALT
jgi:hypothetical protein